MYTKLSISCIVILALTLVLHACLCVSYIFLFISNGSAKIEALPFTISFLCIIFSIASLSYKATRSSYRRADPTFAKRHYMIIFGGLWFGGTAAAVIVTLLLRHGRLCADFSKVIPNSNSCAVGVIVVFASWLVSVSALAGSVISWFNEGPMVKSSDRIPQISRPRAVSRWYI